MSVRRSLFVLMMVVLCLPIFVFNVYANQIRTDAQASGVQSLQLYQIERGDVEFTVSAIGTIEADEVVALSFTTGGRVRNVFVEQDDYVLAGDVAIELVNDSQRIAYEQSTLALERAELNMQDIMTVDETDLILAQANIDAAWGSYISLEQAVTPQDIRAAELQYEQAVAVYENLRSRRDQAVGGFGGPAYVTLDAQTGAASFNMEIARLQWEDLQAGRRPQLNAAYARVIQAQRELEQVQAGPSQAQIDQAQFAIEQAEAQVNRAEIAYNRTTLAVPFDGIVSLLNVEVGSLVSTGQVVVELTDISPLHLTVQVDEIDIGVVQEGLPTRVVLDALPDVSFDAIVDQIALVGTNENGIVTYNVDLILQSDDPRLRVGMTAEATIVIERVENVVVVPNLYVRLDRATGRAYVNVLRGEGDVEEVEVQLGLRGIERSEVIAGLETGDVVAVNVSGGFSLFGE